MATRAERLRGVKRGRTLWAMVGIGAFVASCVALERSRCTPEFGANFGCFVNVYSTPDGNVAYVEQLRLTIPDAGLLIETYSTGAVWEYLPGPSAWPIAPMRRKAALQTKRLPDASIPPSTPNHESSAEAFAKGWLIASAAEWLEAHPQPRGSDVDDRRRLAPLRQSLLRNGSVWYPPGIRANIARVLVIVFVVGAALAFWKSNRGHRAIERLTSIHCERCGYDLAAAEHARCPECGFAVPTD